VPDSQQPLQRTIAVQEVQDRRTVKCIHQQQQLAAANALGEEATSGLRERRQVQAERYWSKHLQSNQVVICPNFNPEGDPNTVSTISLQSRQSRATELLLEMKFRIKPTQPRWHRKAAV